MQPQPTSPAVRLPRTASHRGAITYCKLLYSVQPNRAWGGWDFQGDVLRPGGELDLEAIPEPGLVLECAGAVGPGWGHRRTETLYILWRYNRPTGQWRELARSASVDRDWTLDLGPIARRALFPPGPLLVDPAGITRRVSAAIERELEPLDRRAQRLVLLAVYDAVAARVAG